MTTDKNPSSDFFPAIPKSFLLLAGLLSQHRKYFAICFLIQCLFDQTFLFLEVSAGTDNNQMILGLLGQAFVSSCLGLATFSIVPNLAAHTLTGTTVVPWNKKLSNFALPLLTENLRMLFKVLLYAFLLIIPGVIKYARLYFVSLIVVLDPGYEKQEIDPLMTSSQLTQGIFFPLFVFLCVDGGIFYVIDKYKHSFPIGSSPLFGTTFAILGFLAMLWSFCYIYLIYQQRQVVMQTDSSST